MRKGARINRIRYLRPDYTKREIKKCIVCSKIMQNHAKTGLCHNCTQEERAICRSEQKC
jgi:hypothetical protein